MPHPARRRRRGGAFRTPHSALRIRKRFLMPYEALIYEKRGHVAYVTLNRPHALNALNTQLFREIDQAFVDYQRDDDAWIAVLRGAGERAFCAGADLKEM